MGDDKIKNLASMLWEKPFEFEEIREGRRRIESAFDAMPEILIPGKSFELALTELREMLRPFNQCHIDLIPEDRPYHFTPEDRKIAPGELITLDCSVKLEHLWADRSSTIAIGEVEEKRQLLLETAHRAFTNAIKVSKPGTPFVLVIEEIMKVLEEGPCRLVPNCGGHGIGISLHQGDEYIYSDRASTLILPTNGAITVEPVIFLEEGKGRLYAYFEDTIIFEEAKK